MATMTHGRKLTAQEAAERSGFSLWWIYELVRTGKLPAVKFGRRVRIDPDALDDFLENGYSS